MSDWVEVRRAAIAGLLQDLQIEERGLALDTARGLTGFIEVRRDRIKLLEQALDTATKWKPLLEIPRSDVK